MDSSRPKASDELVRVVWASHILSYLNRYTIIASDKPSNLQSKQEVNDDDGSDLDDDPNYDFSSIENEPLTDNSEVLRQKFLDCIGELLAHTKGGKTVTATALREKEDEVEVDIARNNGFNAKDEAYLCSMKRFLAMQDDIIQTSRVKRSPSTPTSSLRGTIAYTAERVDTQAEAVAKLFKGSPYRHSRHSGSGGYTQDACLLGCCSAAQEPAFTEILTVDIDPDCPSTSEVSPLSVALGRPIRVCQLEQDDLEGDGTSLHEASVEEQSWTNPYARVLMTDIDLESENWGKVPQFWDIDGSVLLRRQDREDLDLAWARHICCYCLDVLKPLFERAVSGEISRREVLEQITFEKAGAWKPVDSATGVIGIDKPRPQCGFVARIGSATPEYSKRHSQMLEVRFTDLTNNLTEGLSFGNKPKHCFGIVKK